MEFVYVVNRAELFDLAYPHGFVGLHPPDGHPTLDSYLDRAARRGYFVERAHAEQRSEIKQIIPYTLVVHEDRVFVVRRRRGGGEERLHGKWSVGIGGHINPEDDNGDRAALVYRCASREMEEELVLATPYTVDPVGVINDDANPVGSVHFGVVLVARVETDAVSVREHDALEGAFLPVTETVARSREPSANFETWSALILDHVVDALGPARR